MKVAINYNSTIFLILFASNLIVWYLVLSPNWGSNLEVNFLDVGQGDSILINLNNKNQILIDGGPDKKVTFGLSENLPALDRYIDLVILTHPHKDHYFGLEEVLKRYDVGAVILPDIQYNSSGYNDFLKILAEKRTRIVYTSFPESIHIGDFDLDILWPDGFVKITGDAEGFGKKSNKINDVSIVSKLSFKNLKILLMGDATTNVEEKLKRKFNLASQILKVGHHGSRYSTSPDFLNQVKPQAAIIEVGAHNFYGHPTALVLKNLEEAQTQIFRTDLDGTIKLISDGNLTQIFKGR